MILRILITFCLSIVLNRVFSQLPYAANGRTEMVNGKNIYYEVTGSGTPLLLMHGFNRSAEDWKPYVEELSRTYRVIAVDLPGHGRSDILDSGDAYHHSLASLHLAKFVKQIQLDSFHIMGFSSGGISALYMAALYGKKLPVKKMIVIAAQVKFSDSTKSFIGSLGSPNNFVTDSIEMLQLHGIDKGMRLARQFFDFRLPSNDPDITPKMLNAIQSETLVIHGALDPAAPVGNAWIMGRYIPRVRLWIWPAADHISIFFPEHREVFMKGVKDFLR